MTIRWVSRGARFARKPRYAPGYTPIPLRQQSKRSLRRQAARLEQKRMKDK